MLFLRIRMFFDDDVGKIVLVYTDKFKMMFLYIQQNKQNSSKWQDHHHKQTETIETDDAN